MRLVAAAAVLCILWGCGKPADPAPAGTRERADEAVMSREEFRKAVMGKTPDEVVKAVGKPDSTSDDGDGDQWWTYRERTRDPVTGKIDYSAQVVFKLNKVIAVNY